MFAIFVSSLFLILLILIIMNPYIKITVCKFVSISLAMILFIVMFLFIIFNVVGGNIELYYLLLDYWECIFLVYLNNNMPLNAALFIFLTSCTLFILLFNNYKYLHIHLVLSTASIYKVIRLTIRIFFNKKISLIKSKDSKFTLQQKNQRLQVECLKRYSITTKKKNYRPNFFNTNILPNFTTKFNVLLRCNDIQQKSTRLQRIFEDYGIQSEILSYHVGPIITLFELRLAPGIKSSQVIRLSDDIARSMHVHSIRIFVIPNKDTLGIELSNSERKRIYIRELLESVEYQSSKCVLPIILGQSIIGAPIIADLSKMPHLLIAGTTGSGKSMFMHNIIVSLLYSCAIKKCQFIIVDPKISELSIYNGIAHLLLPVIVEIKKVICIFKLIVQEMKRRYKIMTAFKVRNIESFNQLLCKVDKNSFLKKEYQSIFSAHDSRLLLKTIDFQNGRLSYIVVIVDEIADLMLVAGDQIERYIQSIAQMARAAGIHLIIATQRPSTDIITGAIKANFATRISFYMVSRIDSRIILGGQGAEKLLRMGDMLYMAPGNSVTRVHAPFISDIEVNNVANFFQRLY